MTTRERAEAVRAAAAEIDATIFAKGGTTPGGLRNAAAAIAALPSGGEVVPLTATANGLYTPPEGVDGYAPVKIDVAGGYSRAVGYVTDGLIHHFDGWDNGGLGVNVPCPRTWVDLAGTADMTAQQNAVMFCGGCYSTNSGAYLTNSVFATGVEHSTYEVGFEIADNNVPMTTSIVIVGSAPLFLGLRSSTRNLFVGVDNAKNALCFVVNPVGRHYISVDFDADRVVGVMYDGVYVSESSVESNLGSYPSNRTSIPENHYGVSTGSVVNFLRVYNRHTTTEEKLANLAVDVRRFGSYYGS